MDSVSEKTTVSEILSELKPESLSKASLLALQPDLKSEFLEGLTDKEIAELEHDWSFWARPNQLAPPGDWFYWFVRAGRGFGKTRLGAEWAHQKAIELPKSSGAIIGRTLDDAEDILVYGESGILNTGPSDLRPRYWPGKHRLVWPNGTEAKVLTADKPSKFRGRQYHWVWGDEFAHWQYVRQAHDDIVLGCRLGDKPQVLYTSTPLPLNIIREIEAKSNCVKTRGSTFDNAENLPSTTLQEFVSSYLGTDQGKQELFAEILDLTAGALWNKFLIQETRVEYIPARIVRTIVILDPSTETGPRSHESAIVVEGLGSDGRVYVLEEHVGKFEPEEYCSIAIQRAAYHDAEVVVETNHGGKLLRMALRAAQSATGFFPNIVEVKSVGGKGERAKPVSVAWRKDKCRIKGVLPRLEHEMKTFVPGFVDKENSPNALDAMAIGVIILLNLMTGESGKAIITAKPSGW